MAQNPITHSPPEPLVWPALTLNLDNIVGSTLPQLILVDAIRAGGIALATSRSR
jgi:hypothetical protein